MEYSLPVYSSVSLRGVPMEKFPRLDVILSDAFFDASGCASIDSDASVVSCPPTLFGKAFLGQCFIHSREKDSK